MTDLAFVPSRNCWRVARADRMAVIVDGADYFRALREALLGAKRLAIFVGWDFDFEIEMLPGESDADGNAPDGLPNRVGPFLDALVERRPDLDIYLLKWSGGSLIAPGRLLPMLRLKFGSVEQVHLALDGRHPIGACHHQKIVSIDDSLAFCGGIDLTRGRWDTRDHAHDDPNRMSGDDHLPPWHDLTTVMSGPVAEQVSRLARARWARANDAEMDEAFEPGSDIWPDSIAPDFEGIEVAIARTEPPTRTDPAIAEIEALYLDAIHAAKDCIYLESQYFCADSIFRAIRGRLSEPDGPEIVLINPEAAHGMIEDQAMHVPRSRMLRDLARADRFGRFRILHPVNEAGDGIYVHAKAQIVDDVFLRVGSSNLDRRSMGFDTESDVALVARADADRRRVRQIRDGLIAEHLGRDIEEVSAAIDAHGSVIAAIDALNRQEGRGLRPILPREETMLGSLLGDSRLFDPRYRRSATARLGLTTRHLLWGAAAVGVGAWLYRRARR